MKRMPWIPGFGMLCACLAMTGCQNKPIADFSAPYVSGTLPFMAMFTDESKPGASPITSWHWLFGDGAESTDQDPYHIYNAAGTYNVSLEVTTAKGSSTELKLAFIHVNEPEAGAVQTVFLPGDVPLDMLWMPSGTFMMGSPDTEQDRASHEGPRHSVTVGGFWMARYELTKRQWQAVMGTTPWEGQPYIQDYPESPAVYVSWNSAQDFAGAVNVLTGRSFRLPSEAEWEYACRAGTTTRFYWGDDPAYTAINDYAWWDGNTYSIGQLFPHVVGLRPPNAWGLYDMSGNVWEWCEDDWHDSYTGAPTEGQPWVNSPRSGGGVIRGGSWSGAARDARSASRDSMGVGTEHCAFGFRVAM